MARKWEFIAGQTNRQTPLQDYYIDDDTFVELVTIAIALNTACQTRDDLCCPMAMALCLCAKDRRR